MDEPVGNHFRRVMTGQTAQLPTGIQATAAIVPAHFASEEQVARALARLGKPAAAALIEGKLPTTKAIRSGDLGEIYATEWIDAHSGGYRAPIKRLRWKDHRKPAECLKTGPQYKNHDVRTRMILSRSGVSCGQIRTN